MNKQQIIDAIKQAHASAEVHIQTVNRMQHQTYGQKNAAVTYAQGARDALKQLLIKVTADEGKQPEA